MLKKLILASVLVMVFESPLLAESEVACDSACPSGEVMTSYADGNNVTCICVEQAAMEPTVPDPSVPTGYDPDNTH